MTMGSPSVAAARHLASVPAAARVPAAERVLWAARRNCALSPRQLGLALLVLAVPCVFVAAGFGLRGVWWVAPFAGLELLAVLAAALMHARHVLDREAVLLADGVVVVEHRCARQVHRAELQPLAVRVQHAARHSGLVELRDRSRCAYVGRYVRPERRAALADELRTALTHLQPATA